MIDLHTHSTASDGTLTPPDLIKAATEAGLKALALTDHDTVDGLGKAKEAVSLTPLTFVPGVEISAETDRGSLHILGLHVDRRNPELIKSLDWVVNARNERNLLIVQRLTELGMPVGIEEVTDLSDGRVIGRPHFAQLLLEKGYVKSFNEAFGKYLGRGKPAHVQRRRLDRQRAIEVVRAAGGVPILAHPDQTDREGEDLNRFIGELVDLGLAGIEVFYSGYSQMLSREYSRLADKYDLVRSGGSDFHGAIKPGIRLGKGPGKLYVPDDLLDPIAERAAYIRRDN